MTQTVRGGKRPGAGRKPTHWGVLVRRDVRLTPQMIDFCTRVGAGDFSEGVRVVISAALKHEELPAGETQRSLA